MIAISPKQEERFWSKIRYDSGCWEWMGATRDGYGRAWAGKNVNAHRLAYELCEDDIPGGLEIDHLCRNRLCVNPLHLELVTKRENIVRGIAGQRGAESKAKITHCPLGHEYNEENTHRRPNGWRLCLACARGWARKWRERNAR